MPRKSNNLLEKLGSKNSTNLVKNCNFLINSKKEKLHQLGKELIETTVEGLPFPPVFGFVPWRHHTEIISKCHSLDEALYYIRRTIDGAWSRNYLMDRIKAGEYQKQGHALLFYHIRLRSYVVIELKSVPFEPEFAGKLNYYVNAVDKFIKHPDDNPTIGLLICRDKNMADVQLAFSGITTPLGVASYDNVQIAEIAKQLPTPEQLQERIQMLEDELRRKAEEKRKEY